MKITEREVQECQGRTAKQCKSTVSAWDWQKKNQSLLSNFAMLLASASPFQKQTQGAFAESTLIITMTQVNEDIPLWGTYKV